jgi:hypothetical protein
LSDAAFHFRDGRWGRAKESFADPFSTENCKNQKRGVPRHHGNMLPGNSFPQICVVSVHSIVDNVICAQEYLKVVA